MTIIPIFRYAKIVGNHFCPPEAKAIFNALAEGNVLTLEREPENVHDRFAVKVIAGDTHIGYVPKEISGVFYVLDPATLHVIAHGKGQFSVGVKQ